MTRTFTFLLLALVLVLGAGCQIALPQLQFPTGTTARLAINVPEVDGNAPNPVAGVSDEPRSCRP